MDADNAFPILLPGLNAASSEWVLLSTIWLLAGIITTTRFFGLATGSLSSRLQATPASMALGMPAIIVILAGLVGHFAVIAAVIAELGKDGALADLAVTLDGALAPIGRLIELLPPFSVLQRLYWDYLGLAWALVMAGEILLYPALKASSLTMRGRQNDRLAEIERKALSASKKPDYY